VRVSSCGDLIWDRVRSKSSGYPPEAFVFVQCGLRHTVEHLHGEDADDDSPRHVSGQQLCMGLRDFALKQFGFLARTVLESWNIRRTEDFGRIVFILVETGVMRKSDEDCLDDFTGVFDFAEAFGAASEPIRG
jgi:uncharacterized repeat protein (TIGR04138 family)